MTELDLDVIKGGGGGPGGNEIGDAVYEHGQSPVTIKSSRRRRVHIEFIGGGGGGGGVEGRHHTGWAGGGGKAGEYVFNQIVVEPGRYILEIGKGGKGGKCTYAGHPAPDSGAGGDTVLKDAESGYVYPDARAIGGAGCKANVGKNTDRGESGGDVKTKDGKLIAEGGKGGRWDASGKPGQFPGAGGGGHGGYDGPQPGSGGDGAHGRASIWVVGD